jgi:hypothetical protein
MIAEVSLLGANARFQARSKNQVSKIGNHKSFLYFAGSEALRR